MQLFIIVSITHKLGTKLSITVDYCNSALYCIQMINIHDCVFNREVSK